MGTVYCVWISKRVTIFVHVGGETFVETASATLIAVRLVNGATIFQIALSFARIDASPVNATLEETGTAFL